MADAIMNGRRSIIPGKLGITRCSPPTTGVGQDRDKESDVVITAVGSLSAKSLRLLHLYATLVAACGEWKMPCRVPEEAADAALLIG